MSWKWSLSLAGAGLVALGAAGCAGAAGGRPAPVGAIPAEPAEERLANQAKAIAELEAENAALLRKIEELHKAAAKPPPVEIRTVEPAPDRKPEDLVRENQRLTEENKRLTGEAAALGRQLQQLRDDNAALRAALQRLANPGALGPAPGVR